MPPFIQNLLALPAKTKAILGVSFVAILAIAFIMLKVATAPSYSLIASGIDPSQTGKITAALDEQGITYEIRNNGTALAVDKASMAQARIALAGAGVQASGGGNQPGYELLDQSKLGASQFQQQVTYQRALEGEIARTLSGVEGVSNPTVQIVMPQDDLFQDEATPATAAIQLGNSADMLAPGAVRGMAQTAASSVKGLKAQNVTITDSTGAILWPTDDASGTPGSSSKASAEARYARQLETSINATLNSTLGPNKAKVTVNADLNVDKSSSEELTYGKTGVPITESKATESMAGGSSANSGGTAGTGSNVPTYSGTNGNSAAGSGNYKNSKVDTNFGVDKKVVKTETAPGAVNKLQVALLVDKSVPKAEFQALQKTVAAAAGLDQVTRGDTLTATQMAFVKPVTPKTGPVPTTMLGPLKWVGLGLASLFFLFFMARGMKRRESENLGTPAWLTTIDEPVSLAQLEAGTADSNFVANTSMLAPRVPDASLHQLDQLMEREPERVAAQVKAWMQED
jgi:flagellar M-ring protein FliF